MDQQKVIDRLVELGMTTYEAKVFLALTRLGEASVSQIHGVADVPRSAIYDTIDRLEQRGIVESSTGRPKRFRPLSPKAAINRIESELLDAGKEARSGLESLAGSTQADASGVRIWVIRGKGRIREKITEIVGSAGRDLLIAGDPDILLSMEDIWRTTSRRVKVSFFTGDPDRIQRLDGIGEILRPPMSADASGMHPLKALFIRADRRTVLFAGEHMDEADSGDPTAFVTDDESFVRFILYVTEPMMPPIG